MTSIASITRDAARWLVEHDKADLAPIAALRLEDDPFIRRAAIEIQIFGDSAFEALASWAEELGIPATVRAYDRFLDGRIRTITDAGHTLELWTHFCHTEWVDLQTATGNRFTETPVVLSAATLRDAAVGGVS